MQQGVQTDATCNIQQCWELLTDVDVNEDGKKAVPLDWQNNNFARESRFFEHFFAVTAFSFPQLRYSPLEFSPRKIAIIWRIQRHGMSAIKFEAARYHILTDVSVAVAVVVP